MFAHRYFAAVYWTPVYWPPAGGELGEPEPPAERAKGGKPRFRYVNPPERKEEKRRPKPEPKPQPVFKAEPLPDVVVLELPGFQPIVIEPETWRRITTNVRLREQVKKAQREPKDLDVEAELIRHFVSTLGGGVDEMMRMPEIDEETAPFMLVRFLRQGKKEKH